MRRQNNNSVSAKQAKKQRQKRQIRKYLIRKAIKHISGFITLIGFVFVFLASGSGDLHIIIKLGVSGCSIMWLGVVIYNHIDNYEQELKRRARERKRMRAQMYMNNMNNINNVENSKNNIIRFVSSK